MDRQATSGERPSKRIRLCHHRDTSDLSTEDDHAEDLIRSDEPLYPDDQGMVNTDKDSLSSPRSPTPLSDYSEDLAGDRGQDAKDERMATAIRRDLNGQLLDIGIGQNSETNVPFAGCKDEQRATPEHSPDGSPDRSQEEPPEPSKGYRLKPDYAMSGQAEIASCNCPWCWLYTENLTTFMEHLWDEHGTPAAVDPKIGTDCDMKDGSDMDDRAEVERSCEGNALRKDSGYESGDGDCGVEADSEDTEPKSDPSSDPSSDRTMQNDIRTPPTSPEAMRQDPPRQQLPRDFAFWNMILHAPGLSLNRPHQAPPSSVRAARSLRAHLQYVAVDTLAQDARDRMEDFYWFNPYPRNGQIDFRLPRSLPPSRSSSKTLSQSESEMDREDRHYANVFSDERYWVCPHRECPDSDETKCGEKSDSIVLFVEHLSRHGYVAYKKKKEMGPWVAGSKILGQLNRLYGNHNGFEELDDDEC